MIGRELERARKTFVEIEILRKAGLQKKCYFPHLPFYPLSSSLQRAQTSGLQAGWGGVISERRRHFHFLFSHSSRLSQTSNACLTCPVTTCFQVHVKDPLKFQTRTRIRFILYFNSETHRDAISFRNVLSVEAISIVFKLF